MTISVRRLATGDEQDAAEALARLGDTLPAVGFVRTFLGSESNYLVVGYWDGVPAGFALAYSLPYVDGRGPMLFLWEIGTGEEYRRRGVARAIIQHLLEAGRRDGCSEMFLVTNAGNSEAMPLYENTGGIREAADDVVFTYDLSGKPGSGP